MIGVSWAADLSDAENVGNISVSITTLRNFRGALYISGGNGVESIVFTAADINVAGNVDTSALSFDQCSACWLLLRSWQHGTVCDPLRQDTCLLASVT